MSTEVIQIVEDCERYWIETGVPRRAVHEMKTELEQHLKLAAAEGKIPEAVVGPDLASFAESWAQEQRDPVDDLTKTWKSVTSRRQKQSRFGIVLILVLGIIGVSAAAFNGGSNEMDNELWRWVWIAAAFVFGVGEVFTAGFFILPFAVGAVVAAILAWLNVAVGVQWAAFLVVSFVALIGLRRLAPADEPQPSVGANRLIGAVGKVLEAVEPIHDQGRVKVETEEWRATADVSRIEEGTTVQVIAVRGTRLVVEPVEER
jgi:membrane protein implicated in regulation of membrane protease activity/DNA-binding ferritin-like protein (Dps family)